MRPLSRLNFTVSLLACIGGGISLKIPAVMAESATAIVPFLGNVPSQCNFGTPTSATLGILPNSKGVGTFDRFIGGANGTIPLSCNTGAFFTVSAPIPGTSLAQDYINQPDALCRVRVARLPGVGVLENSNCSEPASETISDGNSTLQLDLSVRAGLVPPGDYHYDVQVTANPL